MSSTRPGRRTTQRVGFVSTFDAVPVSEDELSKGESRLGRKRKAHRQAQYVDEPESDEDEPSESNDDDGPRTRLRGRKQPVQRRSTRSSRRQTHSDEEDILNADEDDDDSGFLESDLRGVKRLRTTLRLSGSSDREFSRNKSSSKINGRSEKASERQSDRSTRHKGDMVEVGENEIYRSSSDDATRAPAKPRVIAVREQFKALPRNDDFRMRHIQECETCGQGANFAQLIYCQGCTLAYHKSCMGNRNSREHLVTKIGDGDSVLQCRRCIGYPRKKDPSAPDQGRCVDCHEHGAACPPFRSRKTTVQEQKEREDNNGEDPAYPVDPARINQADNVLFRCISCWRAFHFEHLPSRSNMIDIEVDAEQRFREYKSDWHCKECLDMPAKVSGLIAWKPMDEEAYDDGLAFDQIEEDEKAYLVRWTGMSYFRACWMPGAWVWGVTAASMRKAFAKREDSQHPVKRTEDAIPEDYLRADIVLDIKYTSYVDVRTAEVDKARVREVAQALIKYKGLRYEDAVWEAPPSIEDGERWADFVVAYNDWVMGRYVHPVKVSTLRSRLDRARTNDFAKLEKKTQPDNVEGGELLNYQIEGLNWLYYKWFTQKNAILADEMGLGKTIQIIGFLATLVADWNCFPFLVVVPNSTCPNWRREIKRWAPSLRVVAYYGSRESRDLAYRYELFPETSKELRCHVVVTSYDAASDESCRKFFRSVTWQGLIVDEGQRLKNDKNLLYTALGALKAPFRILLTGTPLQNNQRELFNLLHFLDDSYNAAQLEEEYAELDTAKIGRLHEMIRPFFLRRTKAQVLTFLPPMAQIILPVSMTLVQKKVYRTILANNPTLMKAIFSADAALNRSDRASLSNILMQLRKCLCHPFVYSKGIEERNVSYAVSHRNLVDASSKLKLLEILLPKLKERGHRVLIFSQFLDMLDMVEDFMDGMQLRYQRLDGSINALQKQKRIDEFNALDSPLFAFLLSTRSGGVGINLASADTVIILDPDFNPHQDIQALSRAHRIGQHKKVLCFQLVTRASAEERIMQMGRKKLALDHVLIQEMDADDADQSEMVSLLRHGATELFEDNSDQDIVYDNGSVDALLDRSHMEDTAQGKDKSAETQFSFARVWANNQGTLQDEMMLDNAAEQQGPDPGLWANILQERERIATEDAKLKAEAYGRGRRARGAIDYGNEQGAFEGIDLPEVKIGKAKEGDDSDTDFLAGASGADDDVEDADPENLDNEHDALDSSDAKASVGNQKSGKHNFSQSNTTSKQTTRPRKMPLMKAKTSSSGAQTTQTEGKAKATEPRVTSKGSSAQVQRSLRVPGKRGRPKKVSSGNNEPGGALDLALTAKTLQLEMNMKVQMSASSIAASKGPAAQNIHSQPFNTVGSNVHSNQANPIIVSDDDDDDRDVVESTSMAQN